ncbi:hypothetical protein WMY93_013449 [Mugilogobius chulae]|uniref:G-protein coupled receptors family 1 profile domain-containing protein n=1 Tax=Mugilogobius chulae TaxID=88201 RepID=A0AAW0P1Q3_9GOBI
MISLAFAIVVGNVVTLTVFVQTRQSRTPQGYLKVSLAIADMMVGVLVVPFSVYTEVSLMVTSVPPNWYQGSLSSPALSTAMGGLAELRVRRDKACGPPVAAVCWLCGGKGNAVSLRGLTLHEVSNEPLHKHDTQRESQTVGPVRWFNLGALCGLVDSVLHDLLCVLGFLDATDWQLHFCQQQ